MDIKLEIKNEIIYSNSLEIAENIGTRHDRILRKYDEKKAYFTDPILGVSEEVYKDNSGKTNRYLKLNKGATNFMFLKKQYGQCTENISVFYKKQPTYNPQMIPSDKPVKTHTAGNKSKTHKNQTFIPSEEIRDGFYPLNILKYNRELKDRFHPTQKPILLLQELIKTYTNENELVLNFTMGSGSTGVACVNCNRRFIGIELDKGYFNISINRIFENYNKL